MRTTNFILAALAVAMSTPALAQVAADTGQRVRVHYSDKQRVIGVLESISGDNLMIRESTGDEIMVPRSHLTLVERSLGKYRSFGQNLAGTVVVSALTLGLLTAASLQDCAGSYGCPKSIGEAFAVGVAAGAAVGLPVGIIIGATVKSERWEPVTLPSATGTTLSLSPVVGPRFGVMGKLRFGGSP